MLKMKIANLTFIALPLVLLGAQGAAAESLKLRQIKARHQESVVRSAKDANEACGSNFTTRFDWASVSDADIENMIWQWPAGMYSAALPVFVRTNIFPWPRMPSNVRSRT